MNILLILKVISVFLEMIVSGISEGEAIGMASAMFEVSNNFIRKFL